MTQVRMAVIGDGQMGLVMADALCAAGSDVTVWGPFPDHVDELARTRASEDRLPGFVIDDRITVTSDAAAALDGATIVVNAIPTQFIRGVWERIGAELDPDAALLCVSKGIENETLLPPSGIMEDVLGAPRRIAALSGPTIAAELAQRLPATMLAASTDDALARTAQDLFDVPWLRIYRHDDLIGTELAGATKNVIALAAGIVDGLGIGDNAKSALLARGLAEIARLGSAMGARTDTFFGVAGVGDLATTCFSPSGRNRTCGDRLGRGETLDDILATSVCVVEGVPTTRAVRTLAARHGVDMPITEAVGSILFDGLRPKDAMRDLMDRAPKAERIG